MKKRTEHFIQDPIHFDITCSKCQSEETKWSEYESHIWCEKCQEDIELKYKIELIPVGTAKLLGFDLRKWDMVNKKIIEAP